jgi:pimeloyl-ACP methyl ester carboxylesterase
VTTGGQAYTDTGTRREPAVLLVHGWGADAGTWSALAPLLAVNHRVLTVDVRGHGRSTIPPDAPDRLDPEVIAADLAAVLDATGVERAIAVGHSWGGQLVTALGVTRPDRVAGLVVLDPAYGAESKAELLAMRDRWYSPDARAALREFAEGAFSADTPEAVRERVRSGFRDTDVRVLADAFVAMYLADRSFGLRGATEPYLERITAPTLAVYSSEAAADWARRLPAPAGSRIVVWPGAGHYLHEERPAELARLIHEWLG